MKIRLSSDAFKMLILSAKKDGVSITKKASNLLKESLTLEEDKAWETMAEERFRNAKKWFTHEQAWKS